MTVMRNVANAGLPHLDGCPRGPAAGAARPDGGDRFSCSVAGAIKEGDKKVIFYYDRHEQRGVKSSHGLISCGVNGRGRDDSDGRKAIFSRDTVLKLIVWPDDLLDEISSITIRKGHKKS